ncbi:VCBS repeat-containing protein [Winogradskyella flava]|uniref:VCBS repeat-containing protein n=1 Tax=Winogradskyella flava TaxID=1884876 RepID=A0A842IJV6_9FLAO|nr:VCBS repeat-containing protein [Winogradskyella flava]MBC2843572.1 VCBS repeat-containing protein [Winogradskyella flava]
MAFRKYLFLLLLICFNCKDHKTPYQDNSNTLFTKIPASHSNIDFENKIEETVDFNFLNYSYIYNGGGVAVGDINNDGLEDIYFTSNQSSNTLYLNKGNFVFEDITEDAEVEDDKGWTTGVTMVDINNDGWLDIYVCKSGSLDSRSARQNKLYINQRDNTFKDEALKYGLKEYSFSTQAYFLDYDKDGDLDMYLVNHSTDSNTNSLILSPQQQASLKTDSRDILFNNDNGTYKNVSSASGISKLKAWGLSASIGDFNNDSWPDIYVANDFLEPDVLYINNKDGTFTDEILTRFKHMSANSMGSDFADINNDLQPDLLVLDMMAADRKRGKENMATMSTAKFNRIVNKGWHHQYMSNMLQLNYGNGSFAEIGQFSGVAKTDWSWAPLIADFDNDGFNDIFITNGIEKDIANQDFKQTILGKNLRNNREQTFNEAKDLIPSAKLSNYMFINNRDYTFRDSSFDFGFEAKLNSNGAVYADLDNDGDLDLVLNNQSDKASIYRNNSKANYIKISLKGSGNNINGIGSRVEVYTKETRQLKELYASRGYQSSVSDKLNFGLGESEVIDSLRIIWSDNKTQVLTNIKANQSLTLSYNEATITATKKETEKALFQSVSPSSLGISYKHRSVKFDDYNLQLLLPQKQSTIDNALAIADVNSDGLDDFFVGNTMGYPAELYIQNNSGSFYKVNQNLFENDKAYNDNNALFFDADGDNDLDLYLASGNYSQEAHSALLQDRLYINDGEGNFSKGRLPKMLTITKAIAANDFDSDGDLDLFIGGRVVSGQYPKAPKSYVLENRNGTFINVTSKHAEAFNTLGLVNDAIFSDYDNDGDSDLIVVGEWMPVTIFKNDKGLFKEVDLPTNEKAGWFQTIKAIDYDGDGDEDYFVGNFGENNKFHPTEEKPLHIYANHFDDNESYDMALTKESEGVLFPIRGKECSSQQTPFLNKKIGTFSEFANSNIMDIYGRENIESALHLEASSFSSYYIRNIGNGNFEFNPLPNQSQFGPTLDFHFLDLNKDGSVEVFGVGNIYDSEVETIRYDASQGYILTKDNDQITLYKDFVRFSNGDVKAIESVFIKGELHLLLLNANQELTILKLKK